MFSDDNKHYHLSIRHPKPTHHINNNENHENLAKPIKLFQVSVIILVIIQLFMLIPVKCQQQPEAVNKTSSETTTLSDNNNNTTNSSKTTENITTSGDVILSNDEFVDFTEAPTLLFDTTNDENNQTESNKTQTTTTKAPINLITSIVTENVTSTSFLEGSTRASDDINNNNNNNNNNKEEDLDEESEVEAEGESETENDNENKSSSFQDSLSTSQFKPPQNVSQYMDYIERLFHDLRHQITDLFEPHIPQLIRTSQMVQLSSSCSYDMLKLALALRQFEPWALRMIDSSGKMPEGIFEGSFTALGSYDECIDTNFASPISNNGGDNKVNLKDAIDEKQESVTRGKYCLVNLSPFLPPKPPADRVELMFQDEANKRNYTNDNQFARLSPMFYYMKFRIGVCVPSTCIEDDLISISNALSTSLRLNITIPNCKIKEVLPLSNHQLIGGVIFGLVLSLVICCTILDYSKKKFNKTAVNKKLMLAKGNMIESSGEYVVSNKQSQANIKIYMSNSNQGTENVEEMEWKIREKSKFASRLSKNWTWMSFSLITNYRIYFQNKMIIINQEKNGKDKNQTRNHTICCKKSRGPEEEEEEEEDEKRRPFVVKCLNGIRVLSLCWVIIANSYITLDPRATKRLTKTREAPKDFLFQLVVQASLAIETFFFLSGVLMSLSFARRLRRKPTKTTEIREPPMETLSELANDNVKQEQEQQQEQRRSSFQRERNPEEYLQKEKLEGDFLSKQQEFKWETSNRKPDGNSWHKEFLTWLHFYVHRYIRMTPATMLVIAFTMFAFRYGDGPLWLETTEKAHLSCRKNWWRHLLHVANYIDTRQMCFIHYWYIAADMQLFFFAPILLLILYNYRKIGYAIISLIGFASIANVFYLTYSRNLPPTLLFYNSDPESRREFGNTIMTKPLTHVLPYMVGMLVGKWLSQSSTDFSEKSTRKLAESNEKGRNQQHLANMMHNNGSLRTLFGLIALIVTLAELFLPYKWNNSHLPTKLLSSIYAAIFRLAWSMALAYLVISCRHKRSKRCKKNNFSSGQCCICSSKTNQDKLMVSDSQKRELSNEWCFCGSGGNILNRLLSLNIFANLSKLSFVAYLIHLPLMSVFIAQTRGLFAFSHILVIHLALSYLLMTFILSFALVHIIEFPFLTLEKYLFEKLFYSATCSEDKQKREGEERIARTRKTRVLVPAPSHVTQTNHNHLASFTQRL